MARKIGLLATMVAVSLASAASAQPPPATTVQPPGSVVVAPGQRLELTIGEHDNPVAGALDPMPQADIDALPKFSNTYEQLGALSVRGTTTRPAAGRLVAELVSNAADGARLVVFNGYDAPIIYSADLVIERGGRRYYAPTSICPVRPGQVGLESWGDNVVGIAITSVSRVDADHMSCNGGSALAVEPQSTTDRYGCDGALPGDGLIPRFQVTLIVNAKGAASYESATWGLSRKDLFHSPSLGVDFAMEGDRVTPGAREIRVMAGVATTPAPTARTADIVLLVNGKEAARRPWRMYAQNIASPPPADPAKRPVGFFGIVPFVPAADVADAGLRTLLASIDRLSGAIEVRIVGDDGSVLADATYDLGAPPVDDPTVVSMALKQAQAAAANPTACQKISP